MRFSYEKTILLDISVGFRCMSWGKCYISAVVVVVLVVVVVVVAVVVVVVVVT